MEQKKPMKSSDRKTPPPARPAPARGSAKPSKPAKKPAAETTAEYVFGWLGRQVGHVKKAVQSDVTAKPAGKTAASKPKASGSSKPSAGGTKPPPKPAPQADTSAADEKVIYRQDKIAEAELPHQPGVILRRTIIDEVVVERVIEKPPEES